MNGTQRRTLVHTVSPLRMLCVYCGMPKGTSQAEVMSKIKPVALAIVELHWSEGIRPAVS